LQGPGADTLNTVFGDCLVKYIDVLGRKGCCRTALEFCKLLLGLNPKDDTHGVLLRIDYYANRAKESEYLLEFCSQFGQQIYSNNVKSCTIPCIRLMPNLIMTQAMAIKHVCQDEEEAKNHNEEISESINKVNSAIETGKIYELFNFHEPKRIQADI
jgi:hypothetical protein